MVVNSVSPLSPPAFDGDFSALLFQRLGAGDARGGIRDSLAADARERRELVKIATCGRHDVFDDVAANSERVGEK